MIPGNEPTGDDRYVGITTVTEQQWKALARVIGRDDMADDDELGTMIGRFKRAKEVNGVAVVDGCAHRRRDRRRVRRGARARDDRRQRRRAPRFDHVIERDVLVRQPGESWIRPRAPFRFHGVPDRELVAPAKPTGRSVGLASAAPVATRRGGRASARRA